MYYKIANKMASFFINKSDKNDLLHTDVDVVTYGIELLLSSIVNLICVGIIGFFLFGLDKTLLFILVYCPIRQFAGGFHASTYTRCTMLFLILFIFWNFVMQQVNSSLVGILICFVMMCVIWFTTPVDSKNKRLNNKKKKKNKKRVHILLVVGCMMIILFYFFKLREYIQIVAAALTITTILLILGLLRNYKDGAFEHVDRNL